MLGYPIFRHDLTLYTMLRCSLFNISLYFLYVCMMTTWLRWGGWWWCCDIMLMESRFNFARFPPEYTKKRTCYGDNQHSKEFSFESYVVLWFWLTGNFHMILRYCHEIDIGLKFCGWIYHKSKFNRKQGCMKWNIYILCIFIVPFWDL